MPLEQNLNIPLLLGISVTVTGFAEQGSLSPLDSLVTNGVKSVMKNVLLSKEIS